MINKSNVPLELSDGRLSAAESAAVFFRIGCLVLFGLVVAQCFIRPDYENILSVGLIAASSLATFFYVFTSDRFYRAPLSSLMILGNNFTTQFGALLFQTLYLNAVTIHLVNPVFMFGFMVIIQCSLICAHAIYLGVGPLSKFSDLIAHRAWLPLGLFRVPTDFQLLLIGLMGCLATFITRAGVINWLSEESIIFRFIEGFLFLVYAPIFIIFRPRSADRFFNLRLGTLAILLMYFGLVFLLGLVSNSRSFIAMYPIVAFIYFSVSVLCGVIVVRRAFLVKSLLFVIVGMFIIVPLSNLAIAFEVVRSQRSQMDFLERIVKTWDAAWDVDLLNDYIDSSDTGRAENLFYNETYLSNPFLNRLVVVKYQDNMFDMVRRFDDSQVESLRGITIDKIWAFLPQPILNYVNPALDKNYVISFSVGDYIAYISGHHLLGGHKLGSLAAHGYSIFSYYFIPIFIFLNLGVYVVVDSLTFRVRFVDGRISVLAFTMIWAIATFYSFDSVLNMLGFFIRALPQAIFVYLISYLLVKIIPSIRGV